MFPILIREMYGKFEFRLIQESDGLPVNINIQIIKTDCSDAEREMFIRGYNLGQADAEEDLRA